MPSADGTPINVYYVHKTALPHDGNNPVLLYGYGGFDVSLLPQFTRSALYFIERGGIYAVANLRGGGEYGEAWHRAGMFEHKPHVFDDFEAVIRWFGSNGMSRPERIAITGGSNGGLLVGALVRARPRRSAQPQPTSASTTCCATRCSHRPSYGPASTATRTSRKPRATYTATRRITTWRAARAIPPC